MYMCVKLFFGDLNLTLTPPDLTNIYTCEVIIILRVRGIVMLYS